MRYEIQIDYHNNFREENMEIKTGYTSYVVTSEEGVAKLIRRWLEVEQTFRTVDLMIIKPEGPRYPSEEKK